MVWERDSPAILNSNLRMTEYNLVSIWTNATISEYALPMSDDDKQEPKSEYSSAEHVHYYGKFGKIVLNNFQRYLMLFNQLI